MAYLVWIYFIQFMYPNGIHYKNTKWKIEKERFSEVWIAFVLDFSVGFVIHFALFSFKMKKQNKTMNYQEKMFIAECQISLQYMKNLF